jgi:hypothetical protein
MVVKLEDLQTLVTAAPRDDDNNQTRHHAEEPEMTEGKLLHQGGRRTLLDQHFGTDKNFPEKGDAAGFFCSDGDSSSQSGHTSCSSFGTFSCSEPLIRSTQRRGVRFNSQVKQRNIPCINDYSRGEIERTWFLPEECFKIHKQYLEEVRMLEKGILLRTGTECCPRGLESSTNEAQQAKMHTRMEALDAVLDEQDEQYEHGEYDDEAIAELYHDVTMSCQLRAHEIGIQDQREAALIYEEDERARVSS